MSMQVSYEQTGRRRQKARTRAALIEAARSLLGEGVTPTVEHAAARARVSRATAYRYFPNQRLLLVAARPQLEAESLLGEDPPDEPEERLMAVVDEIIEATLATEPALRAMLRLSLDPAAGGREELPFRKGRRIVWVEEALEPLRGRLADDELRRVTIAIAAAVGIDALVWHVDVARLSRDEAAESMRWSARALLRAVL